MNVSEAIERRRSVRKFLKEPVPDEVIRKALTEAFLAPNSSNLQPWEFYWVRTPEKKAALVEACFSQPAAKTAQELLVAVARIDTWKRNNQLMKEALSKMEKVPRSATEYYEKLVPLMYRQGFMGWRGRLFGLGVFFAGFFRPVPRGPFGIHALEEVVIKTTALACENFMLSIVAQGFDTCPMEGLDESRVKKVLGLKCGARVVMGLAVGRRDPSGIYSERIRFNEKLFVHEV